MIDKNLRSRDVDYEYYLKWWRQDPPPDKQNKINDLEKVYNNQPIKKEVGIS